MRVRYRGEGPLVVKLSGIAGGVGLYEEEIAAAARAGFRVAALDTSGDRRDDPAPERLTWDSLAREVAGAVEQAGSSPAVLWGTSFGCLIALATAARHPQRVRGLLLTHPPEPLRPPGRSRLVRAFAESRPDSDRAVRSLFSVAFLSLVSWEVVMPSLWARLPALARAAREAATPHATVRRKIELLFDEDPGRPPADRTIPVEIIAGAWDLVAPLSGVRRLTARLPGARVHLMRCSGHAGAYTRPRAYERTAIAALRRLTA